MKREEIIPTLDALVSEWREKFGIGPQVVLRWSLTDDPEPWLMLNNQYMFRASKFDNIPLEEVRDPDLRCGIDEFHAYLDYGSDMLYIGPVAIHLSHDYKGGTIFLAYFMVPNPANPADDDFTKQLGGEPDHMKPACILCCKRAQKKCLGKSTSAFPDLQEDEDPECYEERKNSECFRVNCLDECPYSDDECPASVPYPPENSDWQ